MKFFSKPISPMALEQRLLSVLLAPRPMIRTGRYQISSRTVMLISVN